jgi:hypothetical protein
VTKATRIGGPIINTAQLKEGERAVDRIVRMRELEVKAKYKAERRLLREATEQKFRIDDLEAENERLYDMWMAAKDAQDKAVRKVESAIQARLAKLEQAEARELAEINADGVEKSLHLIAASLPIEAARMIGIDTIKIPRLIGVSNEQ